VAVAAPEGNPYLCEGYRLPTEAEWEYAARGGRGTATYNGDLSAEECDDTTLLEIAWFCGNAGRTIHPVGGLRPNDYGLYDMLGNVAEWTYDHGVSGTDYDGAAVDPYGPLPDTGHIQRGGTYRGAAQFTRAASRSGGTATSTRGNGLGFRVARSL